MTGPARLNSVPKVMKPVYEKIVGLTDDVCDTHLNSEYRDFARAMTAALCRKRPSPLASGHAQRAALITQVAGPSRIHHASLRATLTAADHPVRMPMQLQRTERRPVTNELDGSRNRLEDRPAMIITCLIFSCGAKLHLWPWLR
jgi:hypothetical protein